jgi:Tfp pilus assembly protein PilE
MAKGGSSSRAFFLEIVLNLVIFALCAAVCLQVFAQAKITSDRSEALSHMSIEAQTVAENFKVLNGDAARLSSALGATREGNTLWLYYDADFKQVSSASEASHTLIVNIETVGSIKVAHIEAFSSVDKDPDTQGQGPLLTLDVKRYVAAGGGA